MRLLYLGLIVCMEISSPNGATVGKKPDCCPALWYFSPSRASVDRPEAAERFPPAKHTAVSSIIGSLVGINKQRAGFCGVKSVCFLVKWPPRLGLLPLGWQIVRLFTEYSAGKTAPLNASRPFSANQHV